MPIPDRPVSLAVIEAEWGQEVHDRVFAPKGTKVHGTATTLSGTTSVLMDLTTADDDPGGWLDAANDRLEVPTGADGIYGMFVRAASTSGEDGTSVRIYMMLNGVEYTRFQVGCDTGVQISITGSPHIDLSAGDLLTVRAQRIGATPAPQVTVVQLSLVRLGDERGA